MYIAISYLSLGKFYSMSGQLVLAPEWNKHPWQRSKNQQVQNEPFWELTYEDSRWPERSTLESIKRVLSTDIFRSFYHVVFHHGVRQRWNKVNHLRDHLHQEKGRPKQEEGQTEQQVPQDQRQRKRQIVPLGKPTFLVMVSAKATIMPLVLPWATAPMVRRCRQGHLSSALGWK